MSVYIDNPELHYGRMRMAHMVADTTEELLAMADKIGVNRKWIQKAGTPEGHFDVAKSKRAIAIYYGTIEVTGRDIVKLIQSKRTEFREGKK